MLPLRGQTLGKLPVALQCFKHYKRNISPIPNHLYFRTVKYDRVWRLVTRHKAPDYLDTHSETTDDGHGGHSRYTPDDDDLRPCARSDHVTEAVQTTVQLHYTLINTNIIDQYARKYSKCLLIDISRFAKC